MKRTVVWGDQSAPQSEPTTQGRQHTYEMRWRPQPSEKGKHTVVIPVTKNRVLILSPG